MFFKFGYIHSINDGFSSYEILDDKCFIITDEFKKEFTIDLINIFDFGLYKFWCKQRIWTSFKTYLFTQLFLMTRIHKFFSRTRHWWTTVLTVPERPRITSLFTILISNFEISRLRTGWFSSDVCSPLQTSGWECSLPLGDAVTGRRRFSYFSYFENLNPNFLNFTKSQSEHSQILSLYPLT